MTFMIIGDKSRAVSRSTENLCPKCLYCTAITYALDDRQERICNVISGIPLRLRGPVSRCLDFQERNKPGKFEMDKMAWAIEASKCKVGFSAEMEIKFVPPSERKDIER